MERNRIKTIKSLLEADLTQLSPQYIHDFEHTDLIQQLRQYLQRTVPDHQWPLIRDEMFSQMEQLLAIPLPPILVKSWHTHEAVKRAIAQQQANPDNDEASIVVLDAHEIRSTHSPTLTTKIGQNQTIDLRFFIGVVLQLKNISLKIQHGEINSVLAGVMSGNGFMQYQNATLIEHQFRHIKLAGDIELIPETPPEAIVTPKRSAIPTSKQQQPHNTQTPANRDDINTTDKHNPTTHKAKKQAKPATEKTALQTLKTSVIQFTLGVILALVLLFLFWQFGRGVS